MKLGGLLPWEKATGVKNDSVLGVIPRQNEGFWWGILGVFGVVFGIYLDFFAGGFGVGLGHGMGGVTVVLGVVLARLAVLDLTRYVLPNVYTIPLLVVGLVGVELGQLGAVGSVELAAGEMAGLVGGVLAWATVGEFIVAPQVLAVWAAMAVVLVLWLLWAWLSGWFGWPVGMGGGDIKLLLAMVAWLGPLSACWAVAVGCVLWLPFVLRYPARAVPFGVPLVLGWGVVLVVG